MWSVNLHLVSPDADLPAAAASAKAKWSLTTLVRLQRSPQEWCVLLRMQARVTDGSGCLLRSLCVCAGVLTSAVIPTHTRMHSQRRSRLVVI